MAKLSFKLAGGGGFDAALGAVRGISPGKKRGHATVHVLWGGKHGNGAKQVKPMEAVADWKKLKQRWLRLLSVQEGGKR